MGQRKIGGGEGKMSVCAFFFFFLLQLCNFPRRVLSSSLNFSAAESTDRFFLVRYAVLRYFQGFLAVCGIAW